MCCNQNLLQRTFQTQIHRVPQLNRSPQDRWNRNVGRPFLVKSSFLNRNPQSPLLRLLHRRRKAPRSTLWDTF